jgi:iron(III) transport system permease protein
LNLIELVTAVLNTIAISFLCVLIAVPVGAVLAVLLVRTNVQGRKILWIALGSQLAVPLYVFAGGWSAGFGLQGWCNLARHLGPNGVEAMQSSVALLLAVAAIHALAAIPWVCLIISLGLLWTDRNQEEAALLEGDWRLTLSQVVLPKLRPWLWASSLWSIVPILTEMVVTNLYQVPTVAEQVYLDASRSNTSPVTYIAAIGLCMLPLFVAAYWIQRSFPPWQDVLSRAQHFHAQPLQLRGWRIPLTVLAWASVLLMVGLPMINLTAKAGWQPRTLADGTTSYGWSLVRFATTLSESLTMHTQEFYWTAMLASASSSLALLVASLGYVATRRFGRMWAHAGMLLLISIPGPLAGMLVIALLNRDVPAFLGQLYDRTIAAPVLAQQFRLLPMAWLMVNTLVAAIPSQSWELAKLDGFNQRQLICFVLWPQSGWRFVAVAWLLAVISAGELSSSILVLPPGVTTVSMRLFEMLHFGMRHQDSGLCGILLLLGWCTSLVFWKTLKER